MSTEGLGVICSLVMAVTVANSVQAQPSNSESPGSAGASSAQVDRVNQGERPPVVTRPPLREDSVERVPIRSNPRSGSTTTQPQSSTSTSGSIFDPARMLTAILIVVGLVVVLRQFARRMFPSAAAKRNTGVMRVLARSIIAPKQQFLLVQVGRRLIVVADTGTNMSPLAEISDPEEVAQLVGAVDAEKPDSISSAFGSIFGKAREPYESSDGSVVSAPASVTIATEPPEPRVGLESPAEDVPVRVAQGEIRSLMERVEQLSGRFRRA